MDIQKAIADCVLDTLKTNPDAQAEIKKVGGGISPADLTAMLTRDKSVKDAIASVVESIGIQATDEFLDAVVKKAEETFPALPDIAAEVIKGLDAMPPATKAAAKAKLAAKIPAKKGGNVIEKNCWLYARPGQAIEEGKYNLKFSGGPGMSKTYTVRHFAATAGFDLVVEVGCMDGMEAKDFIAGFAPGPDGNFMYVDGPLARAWRAAEKGKTVCVILDEIGLIPRKSKQAFQTATSPDADGMLSLNTGRAIPGDDPKDPPIFEEIKAPMANISIIGTENSGAQYDKEPDTPAIKARFKTIYVSMSSKLISDIIGVDCKDRGWSDTMTKRFIQMWKTSQDAFNKRLLEAAPSIRELKHAISLVHESNEEKAVELLNEVFLADGFSTWFVAENHEGYPMSDQVKTWQDIVNKTFAATPSPESAE
jgi:hypothetical protein